MQVRDFYGIELAGKAASNPGWDDAVCGVLGALSLVGRRRAQLDRHATDKQGWKNNVIRAHGSVKRYNVT